MGFRPPEEQQTELRAVVRAVRRREFPYLPRPRARRNWRLYDRAQRRELPEMLELIGGAVDALGFSPPERGSKGGRPAVPLADRLKVLLVQTYLQLANRPAESGERALGSALGLSRLFSYKTIERTYSDPALVEALDRLLDLTNRPVQGLETTFAIDGTGFPTTVRDHYATARARGFHAPSTNGPPSVRAWVFNVANVGIEFGLVAGWHSQISLTGRELDHFPGVLEQTRRRHPSMARQLADGGYSARWVVQYLADRQIEARILPRVNATMKARGSHGWRAAHWGLLTDPQGWLAEYHQRSRVEGTWSALKSRTPAKIRRRRSERQKAEGMLRALVYNLRRLCYLHWLEKDSKRVDFACFRA